MLLQVLIGSAMIIITSVIHAGGMAVALRLLVSTYTKNLAMNSILARSLIVGALILILFIATLIEAGVWATTYTVLGAIAEFDQALYFSMVTYTTLGYGDIVLDERWQLLSSFEAANGIIMFGWTTALIVVAIHRISKTLTNLT